MKSIDYLRGEWRLLGRVGVDSGHLMIVDPCYVDKGFDYDAAFKDMFPDNGDYKTHVQWQGENGLIFGTHYGDGVYNVYGLFDDNSFYGGSGPKLVIVDTSGELDEDYEDEDDYDRIDPYGNEEE